MCDSFSTAEHFGLKIDVFLCGWAQDEPLSQVHLLVVTLQECALAHPSFLVVPMQL